MSKINQAMILAAGLGTRMLHLTINQPKPLIKVGCKSLIEYAIDALVKEDVSKIIINLHYHAEILESYLKTIPQFNNVEIVFKYEKELLNTAGGVLNALNEFNDDPFYVLNSDSFWLDKDNNSSLGNLCKNFYNYENAEAFMLLFKIENTIGFDREGDFSLSGTNEIIWCEEKPEYIYSGAQILTKKFFENKEIRTVGFTDIWKEKLKNNIIKGAFGMVSDGKLFHVGNPSIVDLLNKELITCI